MAAFTEPIMAGATESDLSPIRTSRTASSGSEAMSPHTLASRPVRAAAAETASSIALTPG